MLKLVFFFFGISLSTFLMAQPDSLIEPPLFKDQTIIDRFPPPPPPPPSIYIIDEENFRIKLFCSEKPKVDSLDYIKQKTYQCQKGGVTLTIIQTTYDNGMYHSDSLSRIEYDLNYTQRKFLNKGKVQNTAVSFESKNGYPGKKFYYDYLIGDKMAIHQVFIVKNTLYELKCEFNKSMQFDSDIKRFFDSFELVNVAENDNPYFTAPTKNELEDKPYSAIFFGETTTSHRYFDSEFGKLLSIAEINDANNSTIGLMVVRTIFPAEITDAQKEMYLNQSFLNKQNRYMKIEVLENKKILNGREVVFSYYNESGKLIQKSYEFFYGNHFYSLVAIRQFHLPEDKRIDEFFESFKLIE